MHNFDSYTFDEKHLNCKIMLSLTHTTVTQNKRRMSKYTFQNQTEIHRQFSTGPRLKRPIVFFKLLTSKSLNKNDARALNT